MSEILYSKFADLAALQAEADKVKGIFTQVKADVIELSKAGIKLDASGNVSQYNAALKEQQLILKQLQISELELASARKTQEGQIKLERLRAIEQREQIKLTKDLEKAEKAKNEEAAKNVKPVSITNNNTDDLSTLQKKGSVLNDLDKAQAEAAISATEFGNSQNKSAKLVKESTEVTKKSTLSQKELALAKAEGAVLSQKETAALKNQIKEEISAKGSIDQRRAALIRLAASYDALSAAERKSPQGIRLGNVVTGLTAQVKELESTTGRAQRNVGNYAGAFEGVAKAGTKAFGVLRTIANILPGFGLSGVILLAIEPLKQLYEYLTKASDAQQKLALKTKLLSEVREEADKAAGEEISNLKIIYEGTQDVALSTDKRTKAAIYLQETYPETFKNFTTEEILLGKAKNGYDDLTASVLKNALATAAKGKLAGLATEELDLEEKKVQDYKKIQDKYDIIFKSSKKSLDEATTGKNKKRSSEALAFYYEEYRKANKIVTDEAILGRKSIEDRRKILLDFVGSDSLIDAIVGKPKKTAKTSGKKAKEINDNTAEDILKSQFEFNKLQLTAAIEKDKQLFDNESKVFDERLSILKQFTADKIQLINLETNFEIQQEALKLAKIKESLREQAKEKGADKNAINDQIAKEEEASAKRVEVITLRGLQNVIKATEDFNGSLKKLKDDRQKIRDEELQQILDYEAFTLAAIKKAREAQLAGNKEFDEKDKAARKKAIEDITNISIKAAEELQATLLFFFTSNIDKRIEAIGREKELLDKDTERKINQINMLGLTEQERIKETAKVQKQAAFDAEELEKRRRKLLVERARFEKAANIASIISSTAQAVIAALGSKPFTPLNIALAAVIGGIGALQLARAAAAPLPQYFKGTDNAKRGTAWVGEIGSELVNRNGQYFLTPDKPTLMDMAGGEKITPAHITKDIMSTIAFSKATMSSGLTRLTPNGMSSTQADEMIYQLKNVSKNKPQVYNKIIIDNSGYEYRNLKK